MAKAEWGTKRTCQSCAAVFYDLRRSPIACPKCGAAFDPETILKSRRSRPPAAEPPKVRERAPVVAPVEVDVDAAVVEAAVDDDADAAIEDSNDLGEDEDVPEVPVRDE